MKTFASAWDALGFSREESASLETRFVLMTKIREHIRLQGWTQAVAATKCGVSQPRINNLLHGRIDKFSVDALINIAGRMGQTVHIELRAA